MIQRGVAVEDPKELARVRREIQHEYDLAQTAWRTHLDSDAPDWEALQAIDLELREYEVLLRDLDKK